MSVPAGAMAGMTGGGKPPGAAAPPGGAGSPGGAPPAAGPSAAPMSTPQRPGGMQEGAKLDCMMAMKQLEKALGAFEPKSEEYKAILKSLSGLAKAFGKQEDDTKELMPAEIRSLIGAAAGPGAPPKPAGGAPQAPPAPQAG